MDTPNKFAAWLDAELKQRGWSHGDLAAKSGLSRPQISRVLAGTRSLGPEGCSLIAQAFEISPIAVFRKAGYLPDVESDELRLEEWENVLPKLTEDEREKLLSIAKLWVEQRRG